MQLFYRRAHLLVLRLGVLLRVYELLLLRVDDVLQLLLRDRSHLDIGLQLVHAFERRLLRHEFVLQALRHGELFGVLGLQGSYLFFVRSLLLGELTLELADLLLQLGVLDF